MASISRLTDAVLVEPLHPGRRGSLLVPFSDSVGCMSPLASPAALVANGQEAIDTWIEAANDLGYLGHAMLPPSRRLVLDAAQ